MCSGSSVVSSGVRPVTKNRGRRRYNSRSGGSKDQGTAMCQASGVSLFWPGN